MSPSLILFFSFLSIGFNTVMRDDNAFSSETNFEAIIKRADFVDKSLFIKAIFHLPEKVLITLPTGWGKSTNLKMLKQFLELQVDKDGHPLTKTTRKRHLVNDTNNYRTFVENSLKITRYKRLMERNFGKYPVIHVDFKCEYKIKDSENAVICFREIIHRAIAEHRYLHESEILTLKEKRFILKWSDLNGKYEEFYGQDVTKALHKLAIILDKQFGRRKIFVLIDNYDHPTSVAMFGVKDGKELNRVIKFNLNIISTLLNSDVRYRCKAVVLGKSLIVAAGIYKLENTYYYPFLGNHTLQEYFGLCKQDVDKLSHNPIFNLSKSEFDHLDIFYGGFLSLGGDYVYNLHSIFSFFHIRTFKIFPSRSNFMRYFKVFCKVNFLRRKIEELANGGTIEMDSKEVYTINDLINVRDILVKDKSEERINENIIFKLLLEQGFLTNIPKIKSENSSVLTYKLPNIEIQTMVGQKLKQYYDDIYQLDNALLNKCVNFLNSIFHSLSANQINFKRALYWFYSTFEKLINSVKSRWAKFNESYIYRLLFSVLYHVDVKNNKGIFLKTSVVNSQFNCVLVTPKIIFVIGLKVNDTSKIVLENLVNKYKKHCLDSIPSQINKKPIYLGLGVDDQLRLSISCLTMGKDVKKAFNVP